MPKIYATNGNNRYDPRERPMSAEDDARRERRLEWVRKRNESLTGTLYKNVLKYVIPPLREYCKVNGLIAPEEVSGDIYEFIDEMITFVNNSPREFFNSVDRCFSLWGDVEETKSFLHSCQMARNYIGHGNGRNLNMSTQHAALFTKLLNMIGATEASEDFDDWINSVKRSYPFSGRSS